MPTVKLHQLKHRAVAVKCPFDCGEYIPRDVLAWRQHMEADHSANSASWDDTGERGAQIGFADKFDNLYRYGEVCYGCGATFRTAALLQTHLEDVHSAS